MEVTVNWMESMGSVWSGDQPFVMRLVQGPVNTRPVQPSMQQIDTTVSEHDEVEIFHKPLTNTMVLIVDIHIQL